MNKIALSMIQLNSVKYIWLVIVILEYFENNYVVANLVGPS